METPAQEKVIDLMIVDDDPKTLKAVSRIFHRDDLEIVTFDCPEKAAKLCNYQIKVILCDNKMPKISGIDLLRHFLEKKNRATRILITGHAEIESMEAAINVSQIFKYVTKPYDSKELREVVFQGMAKYDKKTQSIAQSKSDLAALNSATKRVERYEQNAKAVAHDLRNPLSTLRLGLELVEDRISDVSDQSAKKFLEASLRSIDRLTVITKDLTLRDKNEENPPKSFTEIRQLLKDVTSIEKIAAKKKGLSCELSQSGSECWALVEEEKASRLFFNIIGNAIKYTREGGIRINLNKKDSTIDVEIMDTGDGIPQDKLHWIFERDARLNNHKDIRGTGVGLSVCKEIVDDAKGELSVNSVVGVGSVFLISLPRVMDSN